MKWSKHTIDNKIQNPGILEFSEWMDDTLTPVNNCRKPVHKTATTTTMDFKETFEETILRFLTAHKWISFQLTCTASPTINIDPMIEEITKSHSRQAITSAENKTLTINNLVFQRITTWMQEKTHQTPQKMSKRNAPLDQQEHYIGRCQQFNKFDIARRNLEVKEHSLCFNCLSPSHSAKECASKVVCRQCNGKHHSLLHDPDTQKKRTKTTNPTDIELQLCEPLNRKMNSTVDTLTYNPGFPAKTRKQLQVIPVALFGENQEQVECYAILDNGRTISYVLDTTANGINAPKAIQFDLNVMHAFDQSVINANLVRLDNGRYNDD